MTLATEVFGTANDATETGLASWELSFAKAPDYEPEAERSASGPDPLLLLGAVTRASASATLVSCGGGFVLRLPAAVGKVGESFRFRVRRAGGGRGVRERDGGAHPPERDGPSVWRSARTRARG